MYPTRELNSLVLRKVHLTQRIALRREQFAVAAAEIAKPLEWADQMLNKVRSISPYLSLASIPFYFLMKKSPFRPLKAIGWVMRLAPLVFSFMKSRRQEKHLAGDRR